MKKKEYSFGGAAPDRPLAEPASLCACAKLLCEPARRRRRRPARPTKPPQRLAPHSIQSCLGLSHLESPPPCIALSQLRLYFCCSPASPWPRPVLNRSLLPLRLLPVRQRRLRQKSLSLCIYLMAARPLYSTRYAFSAPVMTSSGSFRNQMWILTFPFQF